MCLFDIIMYFNMSNIVAFVITRGWEVEESQRCWLKSTNLQLEDEEILEI